MKSDYPAFKILTFCVTTTSNKRVGFLRLRRKYIREDKFINIITNPNEFNDILNKQSYNQGNTNEHFTYIYSILRKSDNRVMTCGDETDVYNGPTGIPNYKETIGSFLIDGEYYMDWKLSSKSGIQAFFGGGTFVDIADFNKTPLKIIRKEKLKNLFQII